MRKRGRPLGPIALAVLDLLRQRPLSAREAAQALLLSTEAAKLTCHRLMVCGLIDVKEMKVVHGCNKPVRVYEAMRGSAHRPAMMVPQAFFGSRK